MTANFLKYIKNILLESVSKPVVSKSLCKHFVGFICACLFFATGTVYASFEQQRKIFRDASHALNTNQYVSFAVLLNQLDGYPVKPYLEYDALKRHIHKANKEEMSEFFEKYADYSFIYHLKARWLSVLAKREDWRTYLLFFDNRDNSRFQCLAFKARLKLSLVDNINEGIKKVWLHGYSQPDECDMAFDYLLKTEPNVAKIVWQRVELAFGARRPGLAKYLSKHLGPEDKKVVGIWYEAHQRPEKSLRRLLKGEDNTKMRKIMVHALDRLARKDSAAARELWLELNKKFDFSRQQKNKLIQRIALSSAYQGADKAQQLLTELPAALKNDQAFLWLARTHLRNQNWQELIDTINQMPEHLQQENEWQYWLARGLEIQGQSGDADQLYRAVAKKGSYYGFLAADKIKQVYSIEQENVVITENFDEEKLLANNPYMLRARELFYLDRKVDANREWFKALRRLDTQQIKQAAEAASRWQWHDSAIRTVAKTEHRKDYSLRFPMPYRKDVMIHSKKKQLDPSVIYGVMRRESLFNPQARSSVGALGLMQLMPSTARQVAKSLGLGKQRRSDILNVKNNINLGTQYFRTVLNRFDNNVSLAAAAYNAGPLNVKRWLPENEAMPADLWVEIVPFKETRNYVQAVLAYATVFDKTLGKDTRISSRMIAVKSNY